MLTSLSKQIERNFVTYGFVGLGCFFLFILGWRPFDTPDEGRYMQIGWEMFTSGDWVTPRLNGIKYFEKPPFVYWILGLFQGLFGTTEFVGRLVPALFGFGGVVGQFYFVQKLYDRKTAIWAAVILGTSLLYFGLSRVIILDMAAAVLISLALYAGIAVFHARNKGEETKFKILLYTFMALAVLTKGLIGLVLPGLVFFLWMFWAKEYNVLRFTYWLPGILLFLGIAAPWHILVSAKNPEFPYFYFVYEHFIRYTTTEHGRYQPFWFFLPIIFAGLFPWFFFLTSSLKESWRKGFEDPKAKFIWTWIISITVFFSIANSKLVPYILPVFPPLSLILAQFIQQWVEKERLRAHYRWIFAAFFTIFLGVVIYLVHRDGLMTAQIPLSFPLLGIWFIGFIVWMVAKVRTREKFILTLLTFIIGFYPLAEQSYQHLRRPSFKPLAQEILRSAPEDAVIVQYISYAYDAPVYLGQRTKLVGVGSEFDFGLKQDDPEKESVVMTPEDLKKLWKSEKTVILLTRNTLVSMTKNLLSSLHLFASNGYVLVFTNRKLS